MPIESPELNKVTNEPACAAVNWQQGGQHDHAGACSTHVNTSQSRHIAQKCGGFSPMLKCEFLGIS